jgi:hypothetical protein
MHSSCSSPDNSVFLRRNDAMRNGTGKRVLIIQSQIKQYRVPFFDKLHAALEKDGITLQVGYSDPPVCEREKRDNCDLSSEYGLKVKGYWGLGHRAIWQPLLREVVAADLVIVEHANKYMLNHLLLPCSALGLKKVAFWGHGRNRQSPQGGLSEWLKRRAMNRVDWWFAYTAGTAEYLVRHGVPPSKITNVQNSVDTTAFRDQLASVSDIELASRRKELGISEDSKVGLFCGGITREKMPEFLVESVIRVKDRLPEFEFLALGSGLRAGWRPVPVVSLSRPAVRKGEGTPFQICGRFSDARPRRPRDPRCVQRGPADSYDERAHS